VLCVFFFLIKRTFPSIIIPKKKKGHWHPDDDVNRMEFFGVPFSLSAKLFFRSDDDLFFIFGDTMSDKLLVVWHLIARVSNLENVLWNVAIHFESISIKT